jgi:hypothetical protein
LVALKRAPDHTASLINRSVWVFEGTGNLLRACGPSEQHHQTGEKKVGSHGFGTVAIVRGIENRSAVQRVKA